ncbi:MULTISPECIES: hypothetical protein [unclassified Streptomyces]|uniref:hypothetical protein n=1 Tax=unclassified Streptomyces TaxID=2593676 RepID=UPI00081B1228|nr:MULTISPECIES: hypothetical protein [unclassified Streptomyces]MYQ86491.1 hypothetical protein [Streptomyces sp. SID4936]SCE25001.1 hypothetical protein GA0115234_106962 [Streptomyces sp. DvalAA-43]
MHDQWNPELQARLNRMAKELLQIGGDCTSPKDLQHYLSELSGLASAIRYSVEHAAWRSLLAEGAPLDGKPSSREVQEQLRRPPQADLDHPGQAAQFAAVCNVIASAEQLKELASSAWLAGLSEETRRGADGARAQRDQADKATYDELLGGIDRALGVLPSEAQQAAREALGREFASIKQRTGAKTPQP